MSTAKDLPSKKCWDRRSLAILTYISIDKCTYKEVENSIMNFPFLNQISMFS